MKVNFISFLLLLGPLAISQNPSQLDSLLLQGIEARSNKEYTTSLELLTKVRTIAEEENWYKQQFLAINNIGANYYSMLDYGEALDNYLEAYTIALKHLDENEEMTVLNNIAILYSKENDFPKAEEYFLKAYKLAKDLDERTKIGLYAVNLGIVANQQNKIEEAADYLSEAGTILNEDPSLSFLVDIAVAENQYKRGNLGRAKTIALQTLPKIEAVAFTEERLAVLIMLSKISKDLDDNEAAVAYGESALDIALNPENRINAYQQLAEIYNANAQYALALKTKDSIIALTQSLSQLKNGRLFENNRVKFEIADYRRELKYNQQKQEEERAMLYTLLGISGLTILLIVWALYNSFVKNKQRRALHQQNKELIELELHKKEIDNLLLEKQIKTKEVVAQLEQERLKNEIENRNRKLAAKALQIASRNELIKEVINSLTHQSEISRNSFLNKKIKDLNRLLKNDSEWESFLTHFEQANHGWLTKIRNNHPQLSANDVRYISYMYMDLSTKEIASLFNITVEASRKRKERISFKLGLNDSTGLYRYISAI